MAYKWNFTRVGGITRVFINSAEDLKHLDELDKKMWTVLSCPVAGLEIDEKSLKYMDADHDSHIRIDEVVAVSKWLGRVLKDLKPVIDGQDHLPLDLITQDDEEGKKIYDAAAAILQQLGQTDNDISMADSAESLDSYRKSKLEDALAAARKEAEVSAPYADKTEAVAAAYKALDAKIRDYFMRAKLTTFSAETATALDVQVARIEAISGDNLMDKVAEIAAQPIARIKEGVETLSLTAPINPTWKDKFDVIRGILDAKATELTEADWNTIGEKLTKFDEYQKSISITEDDISLDDEIAAKQLVDKLLHLTRDFYTLVRNYITFQDFYNPERKAIFQDGQLVVDQRTCDFCVKVADAGAMAAQAAKSNMYLITCDCINQPTGKTATVIAAITEGNIDDIFIGKNCIFYDRNGLDYDARITAIIDNPISIKQAAWSPYRKFGNFLTAQIEKFAADKEESVLTDATAKFTDAQANVTEQASDTNSAKASQKAGEKAASSFDLAKICGVFAAIGMALGYIGSFALSIFTGFIRLAWWQMPLTILALLIVISGPSMFLAWLALRRRNIAPILNANGWAVNADAKINLPFGNTLTTCAKYPIKVSTKDPYDDKTNPLVKAFWWLVAIFFIVLIIGNALGYTSRQVINRMHGVASNAARYVVPNDSDSVCIWNRFGADEDSLVEELPAVIDETPAETESTEPAADAAEEQTAEADAETAETADAAEVADSAVSIVKNLKNKVQSGL